MKRWLFTLAAALSLLVSLAAAVAWPMSHARPLDWHLLGIMHSADLVRVDGARRPDVVMMPGAASGVPFGYWDALWVRSRSGSLTLVAQAADYGGRIGTMHASPPSLAVELAGPERARAAAFERNPDSRPRVQQPAFAWHAEGRQAVDGGGHASVQARMIAVPWWFIVVLGLPLPLLWLRRKVGGVRQGEPRGSANWRNA